MLLLKSLWLGTSLVWVIFMVTALGLIDQLLPGCAWKWVWDHRVAAGRLHHSPGLSARLKTLFSSFVGTEICSCFTILLLMDIKLSGRKSVIWSAHALSLGGVSTEAERLANRSFHDVTKRTNTSENTTCPLNVVSSSVLLRFQNVHGTALKILSACLFLFLFIDIYFTSLLPSQPWHIVTAVPLSGQGKLPKEKKKT